MHEPLVLAVNAVSALTVDCVKVGKEIRSFAQTINANITHPTQAAAHARSRRYGALKAMFLAAVLLNILFLPINVSLGVADASAAQTVSAWWPKNGVSVSGVQPFKASVPGLDPRQYEMFWLVDGGQWNWMDAKTTDEGPHKEADVDLSGWSWRGAGPYEVTFVARQNGAVIGKETVRIYVENGSFGTDLEHTEPSAPLAVELAAAPAPAAHPSHLFVNPNSPAKAQAAAWRDSRPNDARKMDYLAAQPTAVWLGGWNANVERDVAAVVSAATQANQTPVFVAYNVPGRDCGSHSAGGVSGKDAYRSWISAVSRGIGSAPAIVVLEPDALAGIPCLSAGAQQERLDMLASAISTLKSNGNTRVYLDAGHSGWVDAHTMAGRLKAAGVGRADGFSLNVSNFNPTSAEAEYGKRLSDLVGGKRFVIDTSRNGNGSNGEWCNPSGRAVGVEPTTSTGNSLVDAYLWIKTPGESDGACNGGPSAGTWWPEYALSLVR